jgi:hypothetical protein
MVRVRRQTLVIASVTGLAICAIFAMMAGRTLIAIQVQMMLTFCLIYVITIEFSDLQGGLPKWDLCECPRNMQVQRSLWWWAMWQMWRWMAGWFLWHRLLQSSVPIFDSFYKYFHQLYARLAVKMETAQSQARVCATQDGMESTVPSVSQFLCSFSCAFNEIADIHCNDSTGIGSFALFRHVGPGSVWHSATFDKC